MLFWSARCCDGKRLALPTSSKCWLIVLLMQAMEVNYRTYQALQMGTEQQQPQQQQLSASTPSISASSIQALGSAGAMDTSDVDDDDEDGGYVVSLVLLRQQ